MPCRRVCGEAGILHALTVGMQSGTTLVEGNLAIYIKIIYAFIHWSRNLHSRNPLLTYICKSIKLCTQSIHFINYSYFQTTWQRLFFWIHSFSNPFHSFVKPAANSWLWDHDLYGHKHIAALSLPISLIFGQKHGSVVNIHNAQGILYLCMCWQKYCEQGREVCAKVFNSNIADKHCLLWDRKGLIESI
jgi:hypothetical protein